MEASEKLRKSKRLIGRIQKRKERMKSRKEIKEEKLGVGRKYKNGRNIKEENTVKMM